MAAPTPNEYIVQNAHLFVRTERDLIAAPPSEKPAKKSANRKAKEKLIESVDLAVRKNAPAVEG